MRSEIGIDDPLIAANCSGRPFRQKFAVRKAVDVLGQVHDDPHIVLDHEESDPKLAVRHLQDRAARNAAHLSADAHLQEDDLYGEHAHFDACETRNTGIHVLARSL